MSIFEALMLVCFGIGWPVSIIKALKTKIVKGKSPLFMDIIFLRVCKRYNPQAYFYIGLGHSALYFKLYYGGNRFVFVFPVFSKEYRLIFLYHEVHEEFNKVTF